MTPLSLFEDLISYYGPQNWWPVDVQYHRLHGTDPREEIVIGAVLTQATSWKNVEKALANLKAKGLLSFEGIMKTPLEELENLIKPSGYYKRKARLLKEVISFLKPVSKVESVSREELLSIKGIGPETADVILLYAGNRPEFVIDAYTKRIVKRVFNIEGDYEDLKEWFQRSLPEDVEIFKEFHALLDEHAKTFCRKRPLCDKCFLKCPYREVRYGGQVS